MELVETYLGGVESSRLLFSDSMGRIQHRCWPLGRLPEGNSAMGHCRLAGDLYGNLRPVRYSNGFAAGEGFSVAFVIVNIGYALNSVIPLRLGDALKVVIAHRLYLIPLTALFTASVVEKLVDVLKLSLLGGVVVAFAAGSFIQVGVLLPLAVLAAGVAGAIVFSRIFIVRIVRLLPKGTRLRRIFIELHKHTGSYPLGRIFAATAGIWALNVALVHFTFNTYLSGLELSILDAATLFLILALSVAVPSAPAGLGLFEAGAVAYLTQTTGVGNEAALAAAGVFHMVISLPPVIMTGLLLLVRRPGRVTTT